MERSCRRQRPCPQERATKRRLADAERTLFAKTIPLPAEEVIKQLSHLDYVICATRNTAATMTSVGRYALPWNVGDAVATEDRRIHLRMNANSLGSTMLVEPMPSQRKPLSLHVMDREGAVLHEAYLTRSDCSPKLDSLFAQATGAVAANTTPWSETANAQGSWSWKPRSVSPVAESGYGRAGFHVDSILGDNGIARRASLPSWGSSRAWQIDVADLIGLFSLLKEAWMPLGVAVGNVGLVHYHQGEIEGLSRSGDVLQISSKHTTVTVALDQVEDVWVSRVETEGREEHILELYDWRCHCVAMFKDSTESDENLVTFWRQILNTLPKQTSRHKSV